MKIIINTCYGGFGVSNKVFEKLIEKGWKVTKFNSEGDYENPDAQIVEYNKETPFGDKYGFVNNYYDDSIRTNLDLISVIEELGEGANGSFSNLKIVEVPDGVNWEICEYDGFEHVAEVHRTWG